MMFFAFKSANVSVLLRLDYTTKQKVERLVFKEFACCHELIQYVRVHRCLSVNVVELQDFFFNKIVLNTFSKTVHLSKNNNLACFIIWEFQFLELMCMCSFESLISKFDSFLTVSFD